MVYIRKWSSSNHHVRTFFLQTKLTCVLAITIAPYLEVDMMIPPERFAEYPPFPVAVAFPPPAYPIIPPGTIQPGAISTGVIPPGAIPQDHLTLLTIPSNMHPMMSMSTRSDGATTTKIEDNSITFEFTVTFRNIRTIL